MFNTGGLQYSGNKKMIPSEKATKLERIVRRKGSRLPERTLRRYERKLDDIMTEQNAGSSDVGRLRDIGEPRTELYVRARQQRTKGERGEK